MMTLFSTMELMLNAYDRLLLSFTLQVLPHVRLFAKDHNLSTISRASQAWLAHIAYL